jgi:hypothetical protein
MAAGLGRCGDRREVRPERAQGKARDEEERRRIMRTALFMATALLVAGPAMAVEEEDYLLQTAGDLAALCGAPEDVSAIHMCQGFLVGANRVFAAVGQALGDPLYCLPTDGSASRDTAARDFAAWVAATPDAASMSSSDGLLRWARTTYPCT